MNLTVFPISYHQFPEFHWACFVRHGVKYNWRGESVSLSRLRTAIHLTLKKICPFLQISRRIFPCVFFHYFYTLSFEIFKKNASDTTTPHPRFPLNSSKVFPRKLRFLKKERENPWVRFTNLRVFQNVRGNKYFPTAPNLFPVELRKIHYNHPSTKGCFKHRKIYWGSVPRN